MNESKLVTLILGATGKTGSRVASGLTAAGLAVRRAARSGADVRFDWNEPGTFAPALAGADRVYLVPPVLRTDFGPVVSAFLDTAEQADVRHVTFLSVYGTEVASPNPAVREVELDLSARGGLSRSILRPAWFMQNFSETFLQPVGDVIAVPVGHGTEAFVDAGDIAAVAVETLRDPSAHDGTEYAITGPEALTVAETAEVISGVTGRQIVHADPDREEWVAAVVASGVPATYGAVLRELTATIASGHGAIPNDTVKAVTSCSPRTFAEFARGAVAAWTEQA